MNNPMNLRHLPIWSTAFLALVLSALTFPNFAQSPPSAASGGGGYEDIAVIPGNYVLEPDDVLDISVLGFDEYLRSLTVLPDGTINYAGVGTVMAAGKTIDELKQEIAERLTGQIKNPQVTVSVRETHPRDISVLGSVSKQGLVTFHPGMHLLDAIASCEGLMQPPDLSDCTLITDNEAQQFKIDLNRLYIGKDTSENAALSPGDIILITARDPENSMVQVLGQVRNPGLFHVLPTGGTILDVLSQAGGALDGAALTHVQISRDGQVTELNLHPILFNIDDPVGETRILPGDIVNVPLNNNRIAVLGEVHVPQIVTIPDGETWTILTAVTMAEGLTQDSDNKRITIIRTNSDGRVALTTVSENDFMRGKPGAVNPIVQAGDIIVVPKRHEDVSPLQAIQLALESGIGIDALSNSHL